VALFVAPPPHALGTSARQIPTVRITRLHISREFESWVSQGVIDDLRRRRASRDLEPAFVAGGTAPSAQSEQRCGEAGAPLLAKQGAVTQETLPLVHRETKNAASAILNTHGNRTGFSDS
jgi:hypothetical protein